MNDLLTTAPRGYSLTRTIGRGASSVVWEAERSAPGDRVALKILEADVSDGDAVRRFEREREAMTTLARHRNILTIVDAGVQSGRPWLAMELCRRGSLASHVAHGGPLDPPTALRVLGRLADALAVAHEAGVVHCDVKPANVMLTDAGEPALGDFGIARVSVGRATTTTVGGFSLDHVAPELLDDGKRSPQSDVYSLGTTVWELLAGHPPFRRTDDVSVGAVLTRVLRQPLPDSPRIPADLLAFLRRMAAKEPQERPASMREVAAEVQVLARQWDVDLDGVPLPALTAVERELADQPLTSVDPQEDAATRLRAAARVPAAKKRRLRRAGGSGVAVASVLLVAVLGAAVVVAQTLGGGGTAAPAAVALQGSADPPAPAPVSTPTTSATPAESPTPELPAAEPVAARPIRNSAPAAPPGAPVRPAPPAPTRVTTKPPVPTTVPVTTTVTRTTPCARPKPIRGDIDHDGKVGATDREILLAQWNKTGPDLAGDLNGDETVNTTDLSMLLSNWNAVSDTGC